MDSTVDTDKSKLSPGAHRAVDKVKEALKKTGHVAEHGLQDAAEAAVMALMASGNISFGE